MGQASAAFEGIKVLDMTWVVVGLTAVRVLADYGATVVKVESSTRVDTARTAGPHMDGKPAAETSACFNNGNAGKLGLTLNLASPAAREVVLRLVRWADVLAENFTPRVMRRWGLDWETLRQVNPRLVYLSASMAGQYGPHSKLTAIGNIGGALAGFNYLVGWPDRLPTGPGGAYTDYVAAKYITIAILAALEYRERTGEGQYIDLAQFETGIHYLAPAHLDYDVNGRIASAPGNRSAEHVPHGVFPCLGDDAWVALAVEDERQWLALCDAMGRPDLAADASLQDVLNRRQREDEIEEAISAWTRGQRAESVAETLAGQGLPAYAALDSAGALDDPQLRARGHFVEVEHPVLGPITLESSRFHLSATPASVAMAGPTFGQHNDLVLREILGLDDEAITELAAAGALE